MIEKIDIHIISNLCTYIIYFSLWFRPWRALFLLIKLLFFFLGFCLCCCRCAGKCGAYPQHFDKRRDACKRSSLGVILSVFVIAAMFGGKLFVYINLFTFCVSTFLHTSLYLFVYSRHSIRYQSICSRRCYDLTRKNSRSSGWYQCLFEINRERSVKIFLINWPYKSYSAVL